MSPIVCLSVHPSVPIGNDIFCIILTGVFIPVRNFSRLSVDLFVKKSFVCSRGVLQTQGILSQCWFVGFNFVTPVLMTEKWGKGEGRGGAGKWLQTGSHRIFLRPWPIAMCHYIQVSILRDKTKVRYKYTYIVYFCFSIRIVHGDREVISHWNEAILSLWGGHDLAWSVSGICSTADKMLSRAGQAKLELEISSMELIMS